MKKNKILNSMAAVPFLIGSQMAFSGTIHPDEDPFRQAVNELEENGVQNQREISPTDGLELKVLEEAASKDERIPESYQVKCIFPKGTGYNGLNFCEDKTIAPKIEKIVNPNEKVQNGIIDGPELIWVMEKTQACPIDGKQETTITISQDGNISISPANTDPGYLERYCRSKSKPQNNKDKKKEIDVVIPKTEIFGLYLGSLDGFPSSYNLETETVTDYYRAGESNKLIPSSFTYNRTPNEIVKDYLCNISDDDFSPKDHEQSAHTYSLNMGFSLGSELVFSKQVDLEKILTKEKVNSSTENYFGDDDYNYHVEYSEDDSNCNGGISLERMQKALATAGSYDVGAILQNENLENGIGGANGWNLTHSLKSNLYQMGESTPGSIVLALVPARTALYEHINDHTKREELPKIIENYQESSKNCASKDWGCHYMSGVYVETEKKLGGFD